MKATDLIDAKEAASICGCTAKTITLWVKSGKLTPAFKGTGLRGIYLFNRADVEALEAA